MHGPEIRVEFCREDKGSDPLTIVLRHPIDEEACAKIVSEGLDNRTRLFLSAHPSSVGDEREWYSSIGKLEDRINWAIYADETYIGGCGFHNIDLADRNAELGLMIVDKSYWGRGIATVVEVAITEYAFRNITAGGLHKVYARVFVSDDGKGNNASRAAILKVGYREVGVQREHLWRQGRFYDCWMCEMLKIEWEQIRLSRMKGAGITTLNLYPGCEEIGFPPIKIA